MKLVIFPAVDAQRLARIEAVAGSLQIVNALDEEQASEEMVQADAFFGKLTPELLSRAQRLQWVQCPTASLEHYVFPELVKHPAVLTNMRGIYSDVITDHVFAYLLAFARNLHLYIRRQQEARWEAVGGEGGRPVFTTGPAAVSDSDRAHLQLSDCTMGIVGLGNIGSEIAARASAFGMRVVAVDPVQEEAPAEVAELWRPSDLDRLLEQSDFVVIAAPHTPETAGLFGSHQFKVMKPTAFLVNIGRGVIVRLNELVDALREGEIAGAGLDVFETEPLPPDHPLWQMENVIITPHVAACTVHLAERHLKVILENVQRFSEGKALLNVASKTDWF